jgi:hypothetical protein
MMGSSTELAFFEDLIAQSRHACLCDAEDISVDKRPSSELYKRRLLCTAAGKAPRLSLKVHKWLKVPGHLDQQSENLLCSYATLLAQSNCMMQEIGMTTLWNIISYPPGCSSLLSGET